MIPVSFLLAWRNTTYRKRRTWLTIAALSVSIMFLFIEVGFERLSRRAHTLLFERLDFDLVIVSDTYESIKDVRDFSVTRLSQTAAISGVGHVAALNIEWRDWTNRQTKEQSTCMMIGLDLNPAFIRDDEIRQNMEKIHLGNQVLFDRLSDPDLGRAEIGSTGKLAGRTVTVAGFFTMGSDFKSDGRVIMSQSAFYRVTGKSSNRLNIGLIKVGPGEDRQQVQDALTTLLPKDIFVFDRDMFLITEQDYYTRVKPIGIFFYAGMIVSFLTGAVILFQTLATDLMVRVKEFAVLGAIGFTSSFIHGTGLYQGMIYGAISFPLSLLMSYGLFSVVTHLTRLPHAMTASLFVTVLLLSILMCLAASLSALQKVRRTAPADLF